MTPKIAFLLQQSIQCIQNGNLELAENYAKKALDIDYKNFDSLNILGSIKGLQGHASESIDLLVIATGIKKNDFGAQFNLAKAYMDLARYAEALPHIRKAISINGMNVDAYINYAKSLNEVGLPLDAINAYEKALKLNPNDYEVWTYKGLILNGLQNYDGAIQAFKEALRINPSYSAAILSMGGTYYDLRDYPKAISLYNNALEIDSNNASIWYNKGLAHHDLRQYSEALAAYDLALKYQTNYPEAEFSEALTRLTLGDLEIGLQKFEARWIKSDAPTYRHSQYAHLTNLNDLEGKTILVWEEEGFGDAIQFSRFIPKLLEYGVKVIFEVRPELLKLFQCLSGVSLIQRGDEFGSIDYQIPLQSLPLIFKTSIFNIPSSEGYLSVPDSLVQQWASGLPPKNNKLNIGIATSINSKYANLPGHKRAMPLKYLSPLLEYANLFVIQKDVSDEDRVFINNNLGIYYLGDDLRDFLDSAAIVKNMDLVLCVDTSLAHVAGALGKKLFILLSWTSDWRWFLDSSKSPWYSSATLFRQSSPGNWPEVIERVKGALG
jgi:tetratricopeptide (TPR) repeat protein